ncbi:MAG: SAM-dependent methyltransferase, partial [Vicinamibacterales bacterium]
MKTGTVSLVGAGPGDPELWTVRAVRRLEAA